MANLKGCDVSHWQSVGSADGYDFVIVKATEGIGYVDDKFKAHIDRAIANGQLVGCYHFTRANDARGNTAIKEADTFISAFKPYVGKAIPVLDWEQFDGSTQVWNTQWAYDWCKRVEDQTGVKPMIYMSASVVSEYRDGWKKCVEGNYGLWIAGYPSKYNVKNPQTPEPSEMYWDVSPWPFWAIWQYSSGAGTFDYDIANFSDRNTWLRYAGAKVEGEEEAQRPAVEEPAKKTNEQLADEVINGLWGNGEDRKNRLTEAGYKYADVQKIVNQRYADAKKSATITQGARVLPITFVDVNGTKLVKTRDYYIATQVKNGKALLTSGGVAYAWVAIDNLKLV